MNIYIDESGSINNNLSPNHDFIITLVIPTDKKKLDRAYKRFVSSNIDSLKQLDKNKKMFLNGKFHELKGSQFDKPMKQKFVHFFCQKKYFEIYFIHVKNHCLTDVFCQNTARAFNYVIRLAFQFFITNGLLPQENFHLQLDERNEKTETKHFLENYLNTELALSGVTNQKFIVSYFDSANNKLIQIADVLSNIFFSHVHTQTYTQELQLLEKGGMLKFIFKFPPNPWLFKK